MKRKLSLLMVLMMVLSLIPMSAFANASTSGRIEVSGYRNDMTLGSTTIDPKLVFDNSPSITGSGVDTRPITTATTFTVKLTEGNARFLTTGYPTSVGGALVERTSDTLLQVTYAPPAYVNTITDESFFVPFFIEATGTGDIKVKVDDRLNGFKDVNTLRTIAAIQKSASTMIVDKVGNIARNNSIVETSTETARMRIVENVNTAWQAATEPIEIRLDGSDFTFGTSVVKIDNVTLTNSTGTTYYEFLDGSRTLRLYPTVIATNAKYSTSFRNEITIDAPIRVARNTEVGKEVTATVRGEISPTSIVIAKYTDYAVEVKVEKVLDVVAGQDVPGRYVAKLTIEEMIPGSLLDGRVLEVTLPADVASYQYGETIKLDKLRGTGDINIVGSTVSRETYTNGLTKNALVNRVKSMNGNTVTEYRTNRIMEIEINRGSNVQDNTIVGTKPNNMAAKYELFIPFVVATDFTGDLELTFKGAGIAEQKVKIADVKAPVTVEVAKKGDLNIGQQNQPAPDVLIKETAAGALLEYDVVRGFTNSYGLVDAAYDKAGVTKWGAKFTAGTVETTVKLDDNDYDESQNWFTIASRTKDKPGEFLLTGHKITLDRTVPYGDYKINVDAGNVDDRHGLTDIITSKVFFNVVTPHPTDSNVKTVFTIGEAVYTQMVSGLEQKVEMEVAPQVMNNRTMMPIRYVADALGAKVNYDSATRTAIFSKDAMVVSMTLDTNIMYVNGSPVVMDAAPVVQNSRALVSLVNVAQAFGLNSVSAPAVGDIVYDSAAKTVTLFPTAE